MKFTLFKKPVIFFKALSILGFLILISITVITLHEIRIIQIPSVLMFSSLWSITFMSFFGVSTHIRFQSIKRESRILSIKKYLIWNGKRLTLYQSVPTEMEQ